MEKIVAFAALVLIALEMIGRRAYLGSEDAKVKIGCSLELAASTEMENTIDFRAKIDFVESRVRDERTGRVSAQQKLPFSAAE